MHMIRFDRYPHVNELLDHYAKKTGRNDIQELLSSGVQSSEDAEKLSRFAWEVAELANEDEKNSRVVLGSKDNTDMIQDLAYELTKYMKETGHYSIWKQVSDEEMRGL